MDQQEKQFEYGEEIDLMDYVKVILKRKWLILILVLVTVIVASVFSFYTPKVYKIDTAIEIGTIAREMVREMIEEPAHLEEKIDSDIYVILIGGKLGISENKYPKIKTIHPKNTRLITAEVESSNPELDKNILEEINNLILEDHQGKIKVKKELLEKDIERLKTKITSIEEEKKILEAKIELLEKIPSEEQTLAFQFALFFTNEKLEMEKQEIENLYLQINSLKRSLGDIQPTKIVKIPTISEKPIKPKILLNIIIAGVLGIFIGIFLAFFQEWWKKNKGKV